MGFLIFRYIGVQNSEKSQETLTYSLSLTFSNDVDCPLRDGLVCAGRGTCERTLGRCFCSAGWTLSDCSARGVFALSNSETAGQADGQSADKAPAIPIDGWTFWSLNVGCEAMQATTHETCNQLSSLWTREDFDSPS
jgi:hypothetical protein